MSRCGGNRCGAADQVEAKGAADMRLRGGEKMQTSMCFGCVGAGCRSVMLRAAVPAEDDGEGCAMLGAWPFRASEWQPSSDVGLSDKKSG